MIYVHRDSMFHRLHPLTKLALALVLVVGVNLVRLPVVPLVVFAAILLVAAISGVAKQLLSITVRTLLPIFISLFVIQGILFPPADAVAFATLGPIRLTYGGLEFAFITAMRLLTLSSSVLLVLLTTHPADLASALNQLGLPRSIGYVLLVTLQIAPDIGARATGILEAQQSRGLEVGRGIGRIRALPALVGPLVVGALADVEERAMAIESRAFLSNGPKTSLRTLTDSTAQRVARWVLLLLLVALIVARFTVLRTIL